MNNSSRDTEQDGFVLMVSNVASRTGIRVESWVQLIHSYTSTDLIIHHTLSLEVSQTLGQR